MERQIAPDAIVDLSPAIAFLSCFEKMSEPHHLRVDELRADLKHRAVRSGASVIVAQAGSAVIAGVTIAVLARLLHATDFGLIAMAFPIVTIATALRNFGLDIALINREQIDDALVDAVFWITLALNFVLALVVVGLAFALAAFYREPRLVGIVLVFAGGILALGVAVVPETLLKRQMRFVALSIFSLIGSGMGAVSAIALAVCHAGYWALVSQTVVLFVTRSALVWFGCDWRPRFLYSLGKRSDSVLRAVFKSGRNLTGTRALNLFSNYLDRIVVGRLAGTGVLGFYDNGRRLAFFALDNLYTALLDVAVSGLSRASDSEARYRASAMKSLQFVLALMLPALALTFVEMNPIIVVVLGKRWLASAPYAQWLVVAAFAQSLSRTLIWFYLARDDTARQVRWAFAQTIVVLVAVCVGASLGGALGVAAGFAAASWLLAIPAILYALRFSPFSAKDFAKAAVCPITLSILSAVALFLFEKAIAWPLGSLGHCSVGAIVYGGVYFAGWLLWPGGAASGRQMIHLLFGAFRSKRKAIVDLTT